MYKSESYLRSFQLHSLQYGNMIACPPYLPPSNNTLKTKTQSIELTLLPVAFNVFIVKLIWIQREKNWLVANANQRPCN